MLPVRITMGRFSATIGPPNLTVPVSYSCEAVRGAAACRINQQRHSDGVSTLRRNPSFNDSDRVPAARPPGISVGAAARRRW
jgi:hypothetical protein